jgi:PAS domain S-box-containing protein
MARLAKHHAPKVTLAAMAVRPNILIVDDRKENLLATEKILRHLDAGIFQANSGNEALSLVLRHKFAIILLDVQMPEMDGFETAMLMQEHESMRGVPIIFVTAISKEERYATQAAEIGAVDYIFKPINPEILKSKVQVYLDLYVQREQILKLNTSLQKSNEELERFAYNRGLLEAAPDAMVVVSQSGEIVLVNVQAENQFGYRRDELVGQKMMNIIPVGFAERLIADGSRTAAEALAQQIGTGIELSGRRKDGSEFPIEIMLSPLETAEGILVTAAIRNITEPKKSEEQMVKTAEALRRSNDQLQQFVYVASHDLQEPLRMVASYTQLLARRYKGRLDSEADEFIDYAVDGCNRMRRLIQDLLAYAHAGTIGNPLSEISSESALKEALENLRGIIEEGGAIVTHDPLPAITVDHTHVIQVFQNLVENAIKYRSAEVPHVHISATKNCGAEWIFSVRDNGLGIAPQYFEKIFILFQRLHGRQEFNGTGIGLAICKKVVERLGGRIWVESQPEKGSTFYFSLPESDGK